MKRLGSLLLPAWREFWSRERRMARQVGDFLKRLWDKMLEDEILFLASGLAFNVLLCLLPVLLLWVYVLGLWFQSTESIRLVDHILERAFPNQPYTAAIRHGISTMLAEIVTYRKSFGVLSVGVLMLTSASLFSSTRSVLHRVFAIRAKRHFVVSYLLDLGMVLGLTLLILAITSLGWAARAAKHIQTILPPSEQIDFHNWLTTITDLLSMPVIFLLCYILYRYVPAQRIGRRIAVISAATTSIIWELSGRLFSFYLSGITSYKKLYGAYAFILVLMVWIFYSCAIFVLGAQTGRTFQQRRNPPPS